MFIKDISEAENVVNLLNNDNKQKTLTQITQVLVNGVAQAHTADPFSVVSRILAVLPKDTQQKVLEELNWNVLRQLHIQNIPVFPIFSKLSSTLNEDVKQNVMSEISLILQNSIKSNNATTSAQTSPPSRPNTPPPSAPPQVLGQTASPPPAPNFNASGVHQMNTVKKFIPTMPAPSAPPSTLPPRPSGNTVEMKFSKGLTLTGTFNLKPKDPVDKLNSKPIMSINETLKYIIPLPTESAKKALGNLSTPVEIYQFIKPCDGFKSLSIVYSEAYSNLSMVNFIYKVYSVYMAKYILFKRANDAPQDKEMRLRIGEWLAFLGHIPLEKLDKIIQLHRVSVQNFEASNRSRAATRSGANYESGGESKGPLLGNFLLDSEIITKAQLNEALMVQLQFNEILSALK